MSDDVKDETQATEPVKTYTAEEVEELTRGLKGKVDELLNEKKTVAQRAKEAEAEALRIAQESAKQSGKLEEFEASLRGEFSKEKAALQEQLAGLQSNAVNAAKKAALASMSGKFLKQESVDLISQLVKTEFDGAEVKTQYLDFSGKVITTDAAEFEKWMSNHPVISELMRADTANGGGAFGSKSNSSGATPFSKMTITEKSRLANENPKLYAQLSASQ